MCANLTKTDTNFCIGDYEMKRFIIVILVVIFIVSGCQKDAVIRETEIPAPTAALVSKPLSEQSVEEIVNNMSLVKKAAQMVQAERKSISPAEARSYGIGSVLSGGGSHPANNTPEGWAKMYNEYQSAMLKGNQIPILYGVDAVHGHNNVHGAVIFPHNIGLGATRNPELLFEIGKIVSSDVAATGIDWNFAPAVSVVQDIRWGRTYESFGEHPELQELLISSYVKGLTQFNVIATAKHFIGDGATRWDDKASGYKIDQGDAVISEEELKRIHLPGYLAAINAGADSIMVSFSSINGLKMHMNKALITDFLKGELKFEGIVVSDWEALHQLPGNFEQQVASCVNAGVDMLMEPNMWKQAITAIVNGVNNGTIPIERVNDAVTRIIRIKKKYKLFEEPLVEFDGSNFASEESKKVARQAVRESLVLLKNEGKVLPLKKNANILLLGPGINNTGYQCGGWSLEWQGTSDPSRIPGTTILQAFEEVASANGAKIITDPKQADKADVAVLVIGEKPYAEGVGDNGTLTLDSNTAMESNLDAVRAAAQTGLPVVTVMLAGRPMIITDEIENWDAFVMAWLPGSEGGAGIADVLYGDYNFTGKLPVTWPKDSSQFGYNVNSIDYNEEAVLFPYGFGLSY